MSTYDITSVSKISEVSKPVIYEYVKDFKHYFPGLTRGRYNALRFTQADIDLILKIRKKNKTENQSIEEIKKEFQNGNKTKDTWVNLFNLAEVMAEKLSEQDASLTLLLAENLKLKKEVYDVKVIMASRTNENDHIKDKINYLLENNKNKNIVSGVAGRLMNIIKGNIHMNEELKTNI